MENEKTKDEWIDQAMSLISTLVQYFPSHFETSATVFNKVYELQNTRFIDG